MTNILNISILFCLVCIVIQDMKHREISWILIPLTLSGFVLKAMLYKNIEWRDVVWNIVFVSVQLFVLSIYISFKNKKPVNIINTYLGMGDILFLIITCTAFSTLNFIAFYLLSLIITMVTAVVYNLFAKKKSANIPLAGAMALMLILLMLLPGLNFYNDTYLLSIVSDLI